MINLPDLNLYEILMTISKFAAHYMLSPDCGFVKWPVISIETDGKISDVKSFSDGFREEPGVRFYPGLLIPAFIDVFGPDKLNDAGDLKRILNRHFADGTLMMGTSSELISLHSTENFPLNFPGRFEEEFLTKFQNTYETVFNIIKLQFAQNAASDLRNILQHFTLEASGKAGLHYAGRLSLGFAPGLLLLRNVDLSTMKITPQSRIQWLKVPDKTYFG